MASMEAQEKEKTGIRTLKIGYNKVFGYYIEVSNSFKDQVPDTYIRKQTLVNGERYITASTFARIPFLSISFQIRLCIVSTKSGTSISAFGL